MWWHSLRYLVFLYSWSICIPQPSCILDYIKDNFFIYWFWSFLDTILSSFMKLLCFLVSGIFLFIAAIVLLRPNSTTVCFIWISKFQLYWVLFQLYESWTSVGLSHVKFLFCISKIYDCLILPQTKRFSYILNIHSKQS